MDDRFLEHLLYNLSHYTAVPADTDVDSGVNNEIDGETYINCDSTKYMNASHSCIAL